MLKNLALIHKLYSKYINDPSIVFKSVTKCCDYAASYRSIYVGKRKLDNY